MDPDRDGVVTRDGDTYEIVFVRRLQKPIEKVWAALTTPERLEDWLGVVAPEGGGGLTIAGARFELRYPVKRQSHGLPGGGGRAAAAFRVDLGSA
jgi:uncharacterized protein YndB with AHSA1/START domain